MSSIPSIPHVDFVSFRAEEHDLKNLDLLQCQRECETCQKFVLMLSEHVRSAHGPFQPAQDPPPNPLYNDPHPLHANDCDSLSIQIKCEGDDDDNIDIIDYSQEDSMLNTESDPEVESGIDLLPQASPQLIQNVRRHRLAKNKTSDSKRPKAKKRIHISQKQFKCNECNKTFSDTSYRKIHMRVHTGETPYKCDQCEKSFTQSCSLSLHKIIHTGEKPYMCDVCGKKFSRPDHLKIHNRSHTGEKPYMCDTCGNSFARQNHLTLHQRIHTGEKRYKCDVCDKRFMMSSHLKDHLRVHTGEKPYVCTLCGKCFRNLSTFNGHKRVHTGEKRQRRKV